MTDGYTILPGLIPRPLIDRALGAINHSLGSEGIDKARLATYRARTYAPELVTSPAITDLFSASPLAAVADSAIGKGKVRPPSEGQIALRFPAPPPGSPAVPHIDGISSPENGVPAGTLYHFTGLAAVFLSDVTEPDRGNFTVWPGSHHVITRHLQTQGPRSIVDRFPSDLALGPSRPICGRAGDAVLAHYQLAHGIAPNLGPHIRYAIFFRLHHIDHATFGDRPLVEPWLEWPGIDPAA